jgi:hypothetical protein
VSVAKKENGAQKLRASGTTRRERALGSSEFIERPLQAQGRRRSRQRIEVLTMFLNVCKRCIRSVQRDAIPPIYVSIASGVIGSLLTRLPVAL